MNMRVVGVGAWTWLFACSVALAQSSPPPPPNVGDAAGCAACGGSLLFIAAIPFVILVLNVALLVWIARDAKARGVDGAVIWMIFAFFTGPIAWLLYLMSRPGGEVIRCHRCNNGRLRVSATCPHCGNA